MPPTSINTYYKYPQRPHTTVNVVAQDAPFRNVHLAGFGSFGSISHVVAMPLPSRLRRCGNPCSPLEIRFLLLVFLCLFGFQYVLPTPTDLTDFYCPSLPIQEPIGLRAYHPWCHFLYPVGTLAVGRPGHLCCGLPLLDRRDVLYSSFQGSYSLLLLSIACALRNVAHGVISQAKYLKVHPYL